MRVRFRLPCSGFAFATHKILGPFRFCMCRAWVGWSGAVAEEGPCLKESWQQGQPNAVKPEMYAGRPHGCDTTGRASAPGARSGEAPARCRPCRCAPQAWDVCGAGGPGDAPSPPTWARDVAKNSTFLVWLGPFGVSQCAAPAGPRSLEFGVLRTCSCDAPPRKNEFVAREAILSRRA